MTDVPTADLPELWGGLECTTVRIGNRWRDQLVATGHDRRFGDVDAIADLGFKQLRYPVLWERVSPDDPSRSDFRWHDPRLERLRARGVDPILGLVHHGSGPGFTELLDPNFPVLLAAHARRVAERYPWATSFTPVNEPLTTARFSGLYGFWYPHRRDLRSFARIFINECRGVALSMRAIRETTPHAKLIQTEDLGKIFSTPSLEYQADYENLRRWLTFDVLTGRVDRSHPWFQHFRQNGIDEAELMAFVDEPCPPDVIGINHYLTSDRFLDDRPHPAGRRSGNGRHRYADVEAVRTDLPQGSTGPEARLREAWERYGLPVAVTEAHHGCSRDEQLRWLVEVWQASCKLRSEGANICAMTVWALFGTKDWNSLLLKNAGHYEPGPFDIRSRTPRLTALGRATVKLSRNEPIDHPVLDIPGWWHRNERFYHPRNASGVQDTAPERRLLITGAGSALGEVLAQVARHRGLAHVALSHQLLDIADPLAVAAAVKQHQPWAIVNAAGYSRVAEADRERSLCFRENTAGPSVLARVCADAGLPLVTFSSDLVFDGLLGRPYREDDSPSPVSTFGESKAEGERRVLEEHAKALVIRTGALFGLWDDRDIICRSVRSITSGRKLHLSGSVFISPTHFVDLAHAAFDLLIDDEQGIWHLPNRGTTSWHGFVGAIASRLRLPLHQLVERSEPLAASKVSTALTSRRGLVMPTLASAIGRAARAMRPHLKVTVSQREHHGLATP